MKKFYVYVDCTTTLPIRAYYVGKGLKSRLKNFKRNSKHSRVQKQHGINRKIIFETLSEQLAFDIERKTIKLLHTRVGSENFLACNFDEGGTGLHGINRKKILVYNEDVSISFLSIVDAAEYVQIDPALISRIVHGKRKEQNVNGFKIKTIDVHAKRKPNINPLNATQIYEYNEDDERINTYESINAASACIGIHRLQLTKYLNNKTVINGKYWVRSKIDPRVGRKMSEQTKRSISSSNKGRIVSSHTKSLMSKARSKLVKQIDLNNNVVNTFDSTIKAREFIGISKSTMLSIIHAKRLYNGYYWCY